MAGNVVGEDHLQPAPDLAILFPRLDFFCDEPGIRVEEGLGQVGPQRVPVEVGGVTLIPGGLAGMAGESAAWIAADVNDIALFALEDEQVRRETNAPARRAEATERRPLGVAPAREVRDGRVAGRGVNGARRRRYYEDRDARISTLARGIAAKPDTLQQTGKGRKRETLADGAGHTLL